MTNAVVVTHVKKVDLTGFSETDDHLAAEAPLQIRLAYNSNNIDQCQDIAVTMRTPGSDTLLATGFLFTEGIISTPDAIQSVDLQETPTGSVATVRLSPGIRPELKQTDRSFTATAACGVCGKTSMDDIHTTISTPLSSKFNISSSLFFHLPETLNREQSLFKYTGGIHAAALFNEQGKLLMMEEDIGRHNAVDKVIGRALKDKSTNLGASILLLSGRAGFELIQKAAMAGIPVVAAIGAPSSMAVSIAEKWHITLVGFLKSQRFNIYSAPERIGM